MALINLAEVYQDADVRSFHTFAKKISWL